MRLNFRPLGLLERRKRLAAKLFRRLGEDLHFCRFIVRDALHGFAGLGLRDEHSVFEIDRRLAVDIFRVPRDVSDLLPDSHPYHGRPRMVVMLDNKNKSPVATNPIALVAQRPPKKFGRNGSCKNGWFSSFCIDRGLDKQPPYETGVQRNVFFGEQRVRCRAF